MKDVFSYVACLFVLCGVPDTRGVQANAATARLLFESTVRVRSDQGMASGVVVSTRGGRKEVWTSGHIETKVGEKVRVSVHRGGPKGEWIEGTVRAAQLSHGVDWCKISVPQEGLEGLGLVPFRGDEEADYLVASGFPLGGGLLAFPIEEIREAKNGGIHTRPHFESGNSGGPVVDDNGMIRYFVTAKAQDLDRFQRPIGKKYGIAFPVSHWVNEFRGK